jgi:hypothetical protein
VLAAGATGTVSITATAGCPWTAVSNDAWITVTDGASGSGPGTVSYTVAANADTEPRTGTITIAGLTFPVSQNGTRVLMMRVTGSINSNAGLGANQWLAASFTLSRTFTNVSITPNVDLGCCSGRAWLTNALGGGTTAENVLYTQDFSGVSGYHSFFTGLTLGPGTY